MCINFQVMEIYACKVVEANLIVTRLWHGKDFNCLSTNDFDQEDFESIDSIETMANLTMPDTN